MEIESILLLIAFSFPDLETTERLTNLQQFRSGQISALICTDLAARGLDIPLIDTIIQLEFPRNVVDYLHRTGRTARMGASGKGTRSRSETRATGSFP